MSNQNDLARCRAEQAQALEYYQASGAYGGLVWLFDWLSEEICIMEEAKLATASTLTPQTPAASRT